MTEYISLIKILVLIIHWFSTLKEIYLKYVFFVIQMCELRVVSTMLYQDSNFSKYPTSVSALSHAFSKKCMFSIAAEVL